MYSVRLGYSVAISRINALLANGHDAEALVTTCFTVEKTLRRTMRQLIVSAGFTSRMADRLVRTLHGLEAVKSIWDIYDPKNRKLTDIVSQADWEHLKMCAGMRNKMIHGERVYHLTECKERAQAAVAALDRVKSCFDREYGYSGWTTATVRKKSRLHTDPKVRVAL